MAVQFPVRRSLPRVVASARSSSADNHRRHDDESMREELSRLQFSLRVLKREKDEIASKLNTAEKESERNDKMLQVLLTAARAGNGVPGEVLDQVREDVQAMLQVKRHAQKAHVLLENKEKKVMELQHELRSISISHMERDIACLKTKAKAKASQWVTENEAMDHAKFLESRKVSQSCLQQIHEVDAVIVKEHRQLVFLRDERNYLAKIVRDNVDQVHRLEAKKSEIAHQREQHELCAGEAAETTAKYRQLQLNLEKQGAELARARSQTAAAMLLRNRAPLAGATWEVSDRILQEDFVPVPNCVQGNIRGAEQDVVALLFRCRRALELGNVSGLDALKAVDLNNTGRLSPSEFACGLQRISVNDLQAVPYLAHALDPSIVSDDGFISIVDFVLTLPMQPAPFPFAPEHLRESLEAFVWLCRRRGISERNVRNRFAAWLADRTLGFESVAIEFCKKNLGLDVAKSQIMGRALDTLRGDLYDALPSWCTRSPRSRAALLARFVQEIAACRNSEILGALDVELMELNSFLQVARGLGEQWSQEDLEEIALMSEAASNANAVVVSIPSPTLPVVAARRLARAASSGGGFATEFPEVRVNCTPMALEALEQTTSRRRPAIAAVHQSQMPASSLAIAAAATLKHPLMSECPHIDEGRPHTEGSIVVQNKASALSMTPVVTSAGLEQVAGTKDVVQMEGGVEDYDIDDFEELDDSHGS